MQEYEGENFFPMGRAKRSETLDIRKIRSFHGGKIIPSETASWSYLGLDPIKTPPKAGVFRLKT